MKKIMIGDIVEIDVAGGYCYAQITHKNKMYGELLRVASGIRSGRVDNLEDLMGADIAFTIFFPLGAAVKRGLVRIVGNVPVPKHLSTFPTFRAGMVNPKTQKVDDWWLWDGEREWRVGQLTPEQKEFPIRSIWNDTLLRERIEAGWRPSADAI